MQKITKFLRASSHIFIVAMLSVFVLSMSITVQAQSGSLTGQKCPQSVHDGYTAIGPDGNVYPTWHPSVDPATGCWFDHEHGSDPHLFVGFASIGMPGFGYTGTKSGFSEPHEGFKVFVTNNDQHGRAWMIVLHQGTRGPKRALTQFHSLDWYITSTSGQKLVEIHTMADFGYSSPNCSGPGNETPAKFVAIPNSASGYTFSGHQYQRRFVPTTDCASTRVYETWSTRINVGNVFAASPTFDIDNPSTVFNLNNPTEVRYMCEFRSPNEDCASFYNTQWSGNKRGVLQPQQQVSNPGPQEFYADLHGLVVDATAPGALKQFVTNQGWNDQPCFCGLDGFRLPRNSGGIYITPDPGAGLDSFHFGPGAAGGPLPTQPPGPTQTPPASTPMPSATPPVGSDPSVVVFVNPANANPGSQIDVYIGVANVSNLYGLQTQCSVDPNILVGAGHSDGDIFTSSNSFFVDNGFSAGNWTVAASLLQPNPAFSGNGLAYKLKYNVQNAGSSAVTCQAIGVDANGKDLTLKVINGSFNGGIGQQPTSTPIPPTQSPMPATSTPISPTMTLVPPTATQPSTGQLSTITGVMTYQNHPNNAGITVQLVTAESILATVVTNADGRYTFTDVPMGSYGVTAIAPQHLRIGKVVDVTANGQMIDLGTLTLPAGDTDDSGMVDLLDASLVGANFNGAVPPSPINADLNGDGLIDIRDLALIGSNFGLTAPIVK